MCSSASFEAGKKRTSKYGFKQYTGLKNFVRRRNAFVTFVRELVIIM